MATLRTRAMLGPLLASALIAGALILPARGAQVEAANIATTTCDPVTATDPQPPASLVSFDPQIAERIIDTRDGTGGVDGALDAGCTLIIDTSSLGAVEVSAFALSVTVISPERGFFTAFPCAGGLPGTSSVNARPRIPTPNLVVASPDSSGKVCIYSDRGGNVIVDVSGWWTAGPNRFTPIEPTRAYDTRALDAPVKLPATAIRAIDIAGEFVPDDAVSITINLAAVAPETDGFLVAYPCGLPVPLASNLNFVAGERRAVSAIVELGFTDEAASGKLCVAGNATTHFLVDVTGYDAPSSSSSPDLVVEPVVDTRIVDTRDLAVAGSRFAAGTVQRFDLSGVVERPDDAVGVVLNAVAVRADAASFATISPCTDGPPATSSLNYDLNQTANLVVTALSDDAEICVYADTAVDMVIDLVGVVTGPTGSLVNQLSLSELDGELVPLEQDFDIGALDATLRCDGDRELRLRLGLAPRVTATVKVNDIAVGSVDVAGRDPVAPDLPITLMEDGLLSIELVRGAETVAYHVRCLPPDFPTAFVERSGEPAPGWYLTELGGGNSTNSAEFITIMDERGVVVWYQRLDQKLIDSKLLSTGDIVAATNPRGFTTDPSIGHRVIALDGTLVDVRITDSDDQPADKHDYIEVPDRPELPAGQERRAIISYPLVENVDLSNLDLGPTSGRFRCDGSVVDTGQAIVDGTIREISGDSTFVWEWNASNHFSIEESTFPLCFGNFADRPVSEGGPVDEVDPFHINSIDRVSEPGCEPLCDYIVGVRHLDAVVRVDRDVRDPDGAVGPLPAADGYVEWILSSLTTTPLDGVGDPVPNVFGLPRYDAPRLNIVDDPFGGPLRMHDVRLNDDILTMHDNRTGSGQPSRFVAYRIDTTDPDPESWTASLIRQIDAPFGLTSGSLGSARVAEDGSLLMGWGGLQPMFVEYDAQDNELMRISLPFLASAYRIVKYAPDDFDVDELRATAGNTTQPPP